MKPNNFVTLYLLVACCCFGAGIVNASVNPVLAASKLYKSHHYESAAIKLINSKVPLDDTKNALTIGLIYHKNAILHDVMHKSSLKIEKRYLAKLIGQTGKRKSKFSFLHYGEWMLETGKYDSARNWFKRFLKKKGINKKYKDIASIELGVAYLQMHSKHRALDIWKKIKSSEPEVIAELAGAYHLAARHGNSGQLIDKAIRQASKNKSGLPVRVLNNALLIYSTPKNFQKGLDILRKADPGKTVYTESADKQKTIRFYSQSLPKNIARVYHTASAHYLNIAKTNEKYSGIAGYFLSEAAVAFHENSSIADSIKMDDVPKMYQPRLSINNIALEYFQRPRESLIDRLTSIADQSSGNVEVLAAIIRTCITINNECVKIVEKSKKLAEQSRGARYRVLHAALGFYYLQRESHQTALGYLENSRDKNMKNKIASNDPVLLIQLADAYLEAKNFSENLEIYFEMSKEFPAVRQIQEAVQGIYAMEQQSAGDVKIF